MIINLAGDKPVRFYETENPIGPMLYRGADCELKAVYLGRRPTTRREYAQLNRNLVRMKKAYRRLVRELSSRV